MTAVRRTLAFGSTSIASSLWLLASIARAQPLPPPPPFPPSPPGPAANAAVVVDVAPPPVVVTTPAPPSVVIVDGGTRSTAHYEDGLSVPFRGLVEAQLGWSMMDPDVDGHTAALGLSLELDVLDWLALGLHGHASWRNVLAPDSNADGIADRASAPLTALTLTAGPRFRVFTAAESRDHVGLELGAGILWIPEQLRPWGAVIDVALYGGIDLRDPGGSASSDGFVLAPVIRYQQGLADAGSYRAVLVGLAAGLELGTSPRRGRGDPSGPHFTLGVDLGLGGGFLRQGTVREGFVADLGLRMGLVIGEVFEPTVRFDFMHRVAGAEREGLDVYGVAGGFRVLFDPWAPLYLEALAGWAVRNGTPAPFVPGGLFLDAGAGLRWIDCGSDVVAIVLGVRTRVGLLDDDALTSITGVFGVELDGGPRPDRPRCRASIPEPAIAIEAPPPPTVYVPEAPRPEPTTPPPARVVVTQPVEPVTTTTITTSQPAPAPQPSAPSGPSRVPFFLEPMLLAGVADSDRRIGGLVSGGSLALGAALIDEVVLMARFTALGGGDEARDVLPPFFVDDEEGPGLTALMLGGDVRFRVFTDASERSGWTFELGGGYLTLDGAPEPGRPSGWQHGGFVEAAIGHQRGARFDDGGSITFGLSLRYQQGLGDVFDYRALLLAGSIAIEADTPRGGPRRRDADFQYTFGGHAGGGMSFYRFSDRGLQSTGGFNLHFGLPIGRWIEPRVLTDLRFISNANEDSTSPLLSFLGVLRLRLDEAFPMYLEAGSGYAIHYDVASQYSPGTAIVDFGVGARVSDCSGNSDGALEIGVHLRMGVEGARTDDMLYLSLGYEYAGGAPMFGPRERAHCNWSAPEGRVEERYAPPPDVPVVDPNMPIVTPNLPLPNGQIEIEVDAPPPVILEIPGPPPPPAVPGPPVIFVPTPPPPSGAVVVPSPSPPVVVQPRGRPPVVVQP